MAVSIKLYLPYIYEGRLIVKSNFIEFNYITEILSPLGQHKADFKSGSIAKTLQVDMETAEAFSGYELNSLIDEEYVTKRRNYAEELLNEYEKDVIFELVIKTNNPKKLPEIKDAILNYLRNQEYIKKRQKFYTEKKNTIDERMSEDIKFMKSIKENLAKNEYGGSENKNNIILQDAGDLFFRSFSIYNSYMDNLYEIEFNDSFEELSKFEIFEKHASPRWTPTIIITIIAGIVLSVFFIIGVEINRSLNESE